MWNAREQAPAEEFRFFVDSLMGTIRNEIANCEEAAYDSLPLKDAATLLFFNSQNDVVTFAQQVCHSPFPSDVLFLRLDANLCVFFFSVGGSSTLEKGQSRFRRKGRKKWRSQRRSSFLLTLPMLESSSRSCNRVLPLLHSLYYLIRTRTFSFNSPGFLQQRKQLIV